MRIDEIKQMIDKLNLAEKLLLIEDVWDSIAQSNSELPLPEWQKRELKTKSRFTVSGKKPSSVKDRGPIPDVRSDHGIRT